MGATRCGSDSSDVSRGGTALLPAAARLRVGVATMLLGVCLALPAASADPPPAVTIIRADIKNLRNDAGQVWCSLFRSEDGFPHDLLPTKDKAAICEFKGVPPGIYAIAAIHDENRNGKLDRPTFGPPTEGCGVA